MDAITGPEGRDLALRDKAHPQLALAYITRKN